MSRNDRTTNDFDLAAIRERYRQERDKRLRDDGDRQYQEVNGEFAHFAEHDPYTAPIVREPIADQIEVAVLGGGFAGLMAGARVKQAGIDSVRIIEMAGDFGGTWYWNRYPGVQCDVESYCYLPLLEELNYVPREKYSYGPEIFEHCQRIARHYGLYDHALFGTRVTALTWLDSDHRWRIETNRGDDIRARFLIMAAGPYNRPKLPGVPGITSFKGHSFHTSRWDYGYTGGDTTGGLVALHDKRVAVVGTGASAIQCVPFLGRYAKHLFVFQRTPSTVDSRRNKPTDPAWARSLQAGWQRARQDNFNAVVRGEPASADLVCDGWTDVLREIALMPRDGLTPEKIVALMEIADHEKMNALRCRVDEFVQRSETAEVLKAWYRRTCKRPCFNDEYLPTFNRENVTLVDVSAARGVDRITENGVVANGVEHVVDLIVYATGFEITTEIKRRFGISVITGRNGRSLYDHWSERFKTLHGFTTHGFPNQFFTGYTQVGVSANLTAMLDHQTQHIAYIIKTVRARGATVVEPTAEAESEWVATIDRLAAPNRVLWEECTPGYYNTEGGPVRRWYLGEIYTPGLNAFNALLERWRNDDDLKGLVLES